MGIVDRFVGRLPTHPTHPNSRKYLRFCYKSQVFQFTSLPFGLATAPPGLYNDCKGSETNGPLKRTQNSPIPGRLADQVPVSGGSPSEHSGGCRPNPVLWVDQKKSELKPTQVFSFVGYEYHLDSALVKPTQEIWLKLQDLILLLKSKRVLTATCLMSLIGLLASTEKWSRRDSFT